jgi:hypothetical protein
MARVPFIPETWRETMANDLIVVDGSRLVLGFLSDAKSAEKNFVPAVVAALESFKAGDANLLARMITTCNGRSAKRIRKVETGKLVYAAPLKRVLQVALMGVTMKADKETDFGVKFTKGDNGGVSESVLQALRDMGSVSFRSDKFKKAFPAPKSNKALKDADDVADKVVKEMMENHLTPGDMFDLIRAKYAEKSGQANS